MTATPRCAMRSTPSVAFVRDSRAPTQTPSLQSTPLDWVDEASDESFPASDAPAWPASASLRTDPALELLMERSRAPAYPLSPFLTVLYGGEFGLPPRSLVANFVASVDGVVALGPEYPESGSAISGRNPGDRFVMGLLRAGADAVLIGAGTLRATPGHTWTAEAIYPAAAAEFRDLRRRLGRTDQPRLVVVTARGDIDVDHHGLRDGALILTTDSGAERLRGRVGPHVVLRSLGGDAQIRMQAVVDAVHSEGHEVVLTEGGPTLIGQLLAADLLDELFLTVSPTVFGRSPAAPREGLVEGVAFGPSKEVRLDLRSVRRQDAYLFLRYACTSRSLP